MTPKAQQELIELKSEAERLQNKEYEMRRLGYNAEANSWSRKWARVYDKLSDVERYGLSTSEMSGLKREISNMVSLQHGTSLGSRDKMVIGFSKTLGEYVIVGYTSYTGFMRNVRGMGSLAGTKSLSSVRVISKSQYDNIIGKPRIHREHGWGRKYAEERPDVIQWEQGVF